MYSVVLRIFSSNKGDNSVIEQYRSASNIWQCDRKNLNEENLTKRIMLSIIIVLIRTIRETEALRWQWNRRLT